ncbi:DUF1054 family protein [Aerococcaceae bacterium WGS1372]
MSFLFDQASFAVFEVDGVDRRMEAVKTIIQPSFNYYGNFVADYLVSELKVEDKPYVHIAKHLRRTVYPVESTWCAIGGDKRGYKKYPHFQIGMNDEYLFYTLTFIDNIEHKKEIAKAYKENLDLFADLSSDYIIISDHTKLDYQFSMAMDLSAYFDKFTKVKKAELMVGRIIKREDSPLENQEAYESWLGETTHDLLPLYKLAMNLFIK